MTKVTILCGGSSSERAVSLRSGAAVAEAATLAGYTVNVLDPAVASLDEMMATDVIFPVLHGAGGEDGSLQAQFEIHGVRFVGSDSGASKLCFDKWQYRQAMEAAGIIMADAALVQADNYAHQALAQQAYVLKPLTGGSSIDTYITRDITKTPDDAIADTFRRYPTMLMEQLIVGTELTVGILGDTTLPIIEIIPPDKGEFDYENKYNGTTQELCPPLHVSADIQARAQALALQAHQLSNCRDLSRTDIMCDETGSLYVLETNTMPGMTTTSLFPKMALAAGMSMPQLVTALVTAALER